ncbi:putative ATP-dependent RNA helicase t26g10.1 [Clonorchis sinensis]|uniref:RNA helicase n=1 Tax=Clonorchis sinensis TaxID=79923 RepID=A0A8T1MZZ7_CLOSI|nr:putative ATP-dependent RNA helicase t26g10.1 [Clonorchis sinensis]
MSLSQSSLSMQSSTNPCGFQSLGVLPDICDILTKLGWSEPTPIQHNAIPVALRGKDLIGIAETGSGKTGAFLIPIIQQWILAGRPRGFALLLAPTRELAQQLAMEACRLGSPQTGSVIADESLRVVQLVGGEDMVEQALRLAWHKHHMIVATPGRLVDHMKQSATFNRQQLSQIRQLVLDEADRMLSMEFAQDLDTILNVFKRPDADKKRRRKRMKGRRLLEQVANTGDCRPAGPTQTIDSEKFPHPQTHLYSATMTSDVAKLRRAALSSDACVLGGDHSSKCVDAHAKDYSLPSQIRFPPGLVHYCLPVRLVDKPAILNWILEGATLPKLHEACPSQFITDPVLLQSPSSTRTIVFCKRCQEVRLVTAFLRESGHSVVGLTGRMKQVDRKNALNGLDLPGVELVVNFSVPQSEKTYRHRVGRTARAGRSGIAVTLVTRDVASVFLDLEASLAPHLPKTGGDEKDNIFPRWPVPLPQPSGKHGMLVRRRLADLAWTRAGKPTMWILFLGLLCYPVMMCQLGRSNSPLLGGYQEACPLGEEKLPKLVEAIKASSHESLAPLLAMNLEPEILRLEKQVVAGVNYRLLVKFADNSCHQVVVFEPLLLRDEIDGEYRQNPMEVKSVHSAECPIGPVTCPFKN